MVEYASIWQNVVSSTGSIQIRMRFGTEGFALVVDVSDFGIELDAGMSGKEGLLAKKKM